MSGGNPDSPDGPSQVRAWLIAIRPQTLPAAAAPVLVGSGLAVTDGVFRPWPAMAALVGALLIQIGTNLANDYYDAVKGIDTADRDGFTRVTQSGLIEETRVKRAAYGTFALAILVGTYLVYVGGLPILVLGLLSVVAGLAYAGGPYPLGSYGLGDLFVFVFFGILAVSGTYYVQATAALYGPFPLTIPPETVTVAVLVASLAIAGLTTAILVVNNVRDLETDRRAGKRTLAVLVGYRASRVEYVALLAVAYLVPLWFWVRGYGMRVLSPLVTVPMAIRIAWTVATDTTGPVLNRALERTGRLLAAWSILFVVGLVV